MPHSNLQDEQIQSEYNFKYLPTQSNEAGSRRLAGRFLTCRCGYGTRHFITLRDSCRGCNCRDAGKYCWGIDWEEIWQNQRYQLSSMQAIKRHWILNHAAGVSKNCHGVRGAFCGPLKNRYRVTGHKEIQKDCLSICLVDSTCCCRLGYCMIFYTMTSLQPIWRNPNHYKNGFEALPAFALIFGRPVIKMFMMFPKSSDSNLLSENRLEDYYHELTNNQEPNPVKLS